MKRVCFFLPLFFLLLCILPPGARAAQALPESDFLDTQAVKDALRGEAADMMQDMDAGENAAEPLTGLGTILERGSAYVGTALRGALRSAGLIVLIAVFCAVLSAAYQAGSGSVPRYVLLVGTLGIAAVAVSDMSVFVGLGQSAMAELSDFSRALLPTLSSAAAFSGAMSSAAAKYAASALFMEVLITLSTKVVLPLVYAYIAALIGATAAGSEALAGVGKLIKWGATVVLTVTVTAFVAVLSLTGIVTSASDAYAVSFVKSAVSAGLPVVGGIISDAAGTIVAGAGLVKNAVGVFGLLAVLAICLTPALRMGIQYLIYKCAAGLSGIVAEKRLTDLISGIGSALGLVFGMTGACALMLFVSVLSCLKVVSG